jgi:hypothetical protein
MIARGDIRIEIFLISVRFELKMDTKLSIVTDESWILSDISTA